jgi:hypothetical protein
MEHPLLNNVIDLCHTADIHPGDFAPKGNWGIWKHPITGKEHPVIIDYGFSNEVSKAYQKARKSKYKY